MVSTPVMHANTWITTHLPTLEGWEAELAYVADHGEQFTHKVVTSQL